MTSRKVPIRKFIQAMLSKHIKFKSDLGLLNKRKSLPFLNLCYYFFDKPHLLDHEEWSCLLIAFAYILNKRIKNTDGINPRYFIDCKLRACKTALDMCVIASHKSDSYYCRQLIWAAATFLLEWHPYLQSNDINQNDKELYKGYVKQLSRSIVIPDSNENVLHVICSWISMELADREHFTVIPCPKTLEIMILLGNANVNALDKDNNTPLDKLKINFEKRVRAGKVTISELEKNNAINCARILNHHNGGSYTPIQEIIENIRNTE